MIDSVEIGTDTADHSFHQLVSVVASGTSRMMTSSYRRHIVAGSWVCFPSNLNEPEIYLAGAYKKVLQSWTKSVRILHLLTHRTPIPRIWYHYGPSPRPTMVKFVYSGSEMIQPGFNIVFFWGGGESEYL